jgi:UDP-N-acetylmuramoyl-L-alanyl-D-glutamate--2,6-diaminopimelate ligase
VRSSTCAIPSAANSWNGSIPRWRGFSTPRRTKSGRSTARTGSASPNCRATPQGLTLQLETSWGTGTLRSRLVGEFNAENLLAVLGVLLGWRVPLQKALAALALCVAPPGRMESFGGGKQPLVLVDYAHTPDALAKVLEAARSHASGRVICVFGCGGDRDPGKRPLMGAIAESLADVVVVTDDNPRTEASRAIIEQILAGTRAPAA